MGNAARKETVLGLTARQMAPVVDAIAGEPILTFGFDAHNEIEGAWGYSGRESKAILRITYTTRSECQEEVTVFAKRSAKPGAHESRHYEWLADLGVPIPKLYGVVTDADEHEVLFIEFLDCLSEDPPFARYLSEPDSFLEYVALLARFNATPLPPTYRGRFEHLSISGALPYGISAMEKFWPRACNGDYGDSLLALCSGRPKGLEALVKLAQSLIEPTGNMRSGLCHKDYSPAQIGKRCETGELLVADLASVALAPRFFDAIRIFGAPDAIMPPGWSRRDLAKWYLDQYSRWGGNEVPVSEFLTEVEVLWMAEVFTGIWWWGERSIDGVTDWIDDRDEGRRIWRERLHGRLTALLQSAGVSA